MMPRPRPDSCACGSSVDLESCSWRQCAARVCVDHRRVCETCGEVVCLRHAEIRGQRIGENWYCEDCAPQLLQDSDIGGQV